MSDSILPSPPVGGFSQPAPKADGLVKIDALKAGGFDDGEIQGWISEKKAALVEGQFSEREIDDYFGVKQFDANPLQERLNTNFGVDPLDRAKELLSGSSVEGAPARTFQGPSFEGASLAPDEADTFLQAFEAGFQFSPTGLLVRGKLPDIDVNENAEWHMTMAKGMGLALGDIPANILGGLIASPVGLAGGPAAPITSVLAAGAGANAAPTLIREMLMDAYRKGSVVDFKDFWTRAAPIFLNTIKSGVVGAATLGVGHKVGLAAKVASPVVKTTAKISAEIGTLVTLGRGLEGELPKLKDFTDAAIAVVGLGGSVHVGGKLMKIFARTGMKPMDVAEQSLKDPVLRQQLAEKGEHLPAAYEGFVDPAIAPENTVRIKLDPKLGDGELVLPARMEPATTPETGPNALDTPKQQMMAFLGEEVGSAAQPKPKVEIVRTPEESAMLALIGKEQRKGLAIDFDSAYTATVDKFHPVNLFVKAVTKGAKIPEHTDPYTLVRLTRGSGGRATQFIENAPFSHKTYQVIEGAKSLKEIFQPIAGDLDGFRAYGISKRIQNLESRGIKPFKDIGPDAATVAKAAKDGAAKYEPILRDIVKYRGHLLRYMRDAGVLTEEQILKWEKNDPDYATPFYRILEEGTGGSNPGKGLTVSNPVRRLKGDSDLLLVDPVESLVKDTYKFVEVAERNHVFRSVVKLSEKFNAPKELIERVPTKMKAIEVTPQEISRFADEFGLGFEVAEQAMTVFRPMKTDLAPDQISGFRDGKQEVYRVPIELAESLKEMDSRSANLLMKVLAGPAKTLKAGTTILPEFMGKNFIRDQGAAFIFSKNGYVPVLDFLHGIGEQIGKGKVYQQWLMGGGAEATFLSMDRAYIQEHVMNLGDMQSMAKRSWNVISSPIRAAQMFGELTENATRIGEMRRAMMGKTGTKREIVKGSYSTRELTLDFSRIGAQTQFVNQIIAFTNPKIQGLDRIARAFKDDPMGTSVRVAAVITVPSILGWYLNKDDPRYAEIPRWQKDIFHHVMLDKWENVKPDEGQSAGVFGRQTDDGQWQINRGTIWKIPKVQDTGVAFGSSVERFLEYAHKNDPKALKDFMDTLGDSVIPGVVPNIAIPALETFNNKSTFTGAPIVPGHLEGTLPEVQYTDYTTESAKLLGKIIPPVPFGELKLNSPMVIENLIRAWSGGMGMYALQIADKALEVAGIAIPPPRPTKTLADMPVIKAFVVRFPQANVQSIVDFRERFNQSQEIFKSIKVMAAKGDFQGQQRLMLAEENQSKLVSLSGINDSLTKMKGVIERVTLDPQIPPDEKRQLIDGVYLGMINFARRGNELVDELEKTLGVANKGNK